MGKVSLERVYRIWDDNLGFFIQIADDVDSLSMMEISYWDSETKKVSFVTIGDDMFELFAQAVNEFVAHKKEKANAQGQ
jgi:hypothetical protein